MKNIVITLAVCIFAMTLIVVSYKHRTDVPPECPDEFICYTVNGGERVTPVGDNTIAHVQVYWYDSYEDLQNEWAKTEEGKVDAWSECFPHIEFDQLCEIHAVRPEYVWGDPRIDDLGHELLHTLWGDFHVIE